MARKKMPPSMMNESTLKRHYSAEDREKILENEELIKDTFNQHSDLENKVLKNTNSIEKFFFDKIKHIMTISGIYTHVDSMMISNLAFTLFALYEVRKTLRAEGFYIEGYKVHPLINVEKGYVNQAITLMKELHISISERQSLISLTNDGEFTESPNQEEINSVFEKFFGGK